MSKIRKRMTIAENVPKVYEAGYNERKNEWWTNYLTGLKNAQYQNNAYAFSGRGWTDETFDPIYNDGAELTLYPENAQGMFRGCQVTDVKGALEKANITIDFSQANNIGEFAHSAAVVNFPLIDARTAQNLSTTFYNLTGNNVSIHLILKDDGSQTFNNTFGYAKGLTELIIEGGVIGTTINLQACPLTVESMISVINALKPFNSIDVENAYTTTVYFSEACWEALETAATTVVPEWSEPDQEYVDTYPYAPPIGSTWRAYVETELGWII